VKSDETPEERAARHALDKPLIEAFDALRVQPKPRTRADLLMLRMVHGAASAAAEAELKSRAAKLFEEEGSADTWRLPGGQVITQETKDRAAIVDREAFLRWLANAYPHQVEVESVVVRTVINERWLTEELLPSLKPMDPDELAPGEQTQLMDAEGTLIPGVTWSKGGGLYGVSIRPDSAVTRRLKAAAAAYIDGTGPLPGITTGERRGGSTEDEPGPAGRDPED
jgi:hypothetical protein